MTGLCVSGDVSSTFNLRCVPLVCGTWCAALDSRFFCILQVAYGSWFPEGCSKGGGAQVSWELGHGVESQDTVCL